MRFRLPLLAVLIGTCAPAQETLIHSMDDLKVREPKEKGHAEIVPGREGRAVKFSFDEGNSGVFCITSIRANPAWDKAAGFSFWVKGDGSSHFGGLQFIWNDNYAIRYDLMFPIDGTEWKKITVPWRDLIPATCNPEAKFLNPATGNAPSKITDLWFGKWWYWHDYAAHSYTIDHLQLESTIPLEAAPAPAGIPLERVLAKLKASRPITIVTMGDSLTDIQHWANREVNWPALLAAKIKVLYGVDPKIINPALGGTELRQNLILMPRWLAGTPEPDLVTVCFGGNDWNAGMRGEMFRGTCVEAIDRIRRLTNGKADVLMLPTVPSLEMWTTRAELGEAVRNAAKDRNAGLADIEKNFLNTALEQRPSLFCSDKVHLGTAGHEALAATILQALAAEGK